MRYDERQQRTLSAVAEAAPWEKLERLVHKTVQVWGSFSATWKLQGKIGAADYVDLTSAKTVPEIVSIDATVTDVKVVCTAYTSGTMNAILAGLNARTE